MNLTAQEACNKAVEMTDQVQSQLLFAVNGIQNLYNQDINIERANLQLRDAFDGEEPMDAVPIQGLNAKAVEWLKQQPEFQERQIGLDNLDDNGPSI